MRFKLSFVIYTGLLLPYNTFWFVRWEPLWDSGTGIVDTNKSRVLSLEASIDSYYSFFFVTTTKALPLPPTCLELSHASTGLKQDSSIYVQVEGTFKFKPVPGKCTSVMHDVNYNPVKQTALLFPASM